MDNPNMMAQGKKCGCPHHKVVPLLLVLTGATVLAGNFGWLSAEIVNWTWPTLVLVVGVFKLTEGNMCKCC
ncbi:MAG: DUF5668 domain-containing protein [Candidatus Liptonbacteria bacterium]|nr:DUF5668 domain-containing protein [Candidatus Liptonbacteria bacterium]